MSYWKGEMLPPCTIWEVLLTISEDLALHALIRKGSFLCIFMKLAWHYYIISFVKEQYWKDQAYVTTAGQNVYICILHDWRISKLCCIISTQCIAIISPYYTKSTWNACTSKNCNDITYWNIPWHTTATPAHSTLQQLALCPTIQMQTGIHAHINTQLYCSKQMFCICTPPAHGLHLSLHCND